MRHESYRYFLGTHPHGPLRQLLTGLQEAAGQGGRRVRPENLHLTFCTIAESAMRDHSVLPRIEAALTRVRLISGPLRFGRVRGSSRGAVVHTRGPKPELLELYRVITTALAARGFPPLHRQSGLHPHFTLGYDPCAFAAFNVLCEWIPAELLLIESEIGKGIHNVLGRWPLLPPLQGTLLLGDPPSPPRLAAARR